MKLVRWNFDFADEFDVEGYKIMSDEDFNKFADIVESDEIAETFCDEELYFGTNEWIMVSYGDLKNMVDEAEDISEEDSEVIIKYLGACGGMIDIPRRLLQYHEENTGK